MRITVAVSPIEDFYHSPGRNSSLGAKVVCEIIESLGHRAAFIDFPNIGKSQPVPLPESLTYLQEIIIPGEYGPLSFFSSRKRFGPDAVSCSKMISRTQPDMLLISCFAYAYGDQAVELSSACRKEMPECPIIMGGAGPSSFPAKFLGCSQADAVLRGEAEISLYRLLSQVTYPVTREQVRAAAENIQRALLPGPIEETCPSEHIIPSCSLVIRRKKFQQFSAGISRGCPLRCSFCSAEFSHGREFRLPPLEKVVSKVTRIIEESSSGSAPISLNIEDDNLAADPRYLLSLLSSLREKFPEISFSAENGIDYRFLSIPLAKELITLGFRQFNLSAGIIPSSSSMQQNRAQDLLHLEQLCVLFKEYSIPVIVYGIIGFPGDTRELALSTLKYLASLGVLVGISPFYAVPGLRFFSEPSMFLDRDTCLCAGSSLYPWTGSLNTREMATMFRLSRLVNLSGKENTSHEEKKLLERTKETGMLHTYIRGSHGPQPVGPREADHCLAGLFLEQFFNITYNLESAGISGTVKEH